MSADPLWIRIIFLILLSAVANPGVEVRSYGNEVLLNPPKSRLTMLR
jgi:hypothetical protein